MRFLKQSLAYGIPFGVGMGLYFYWQYGLQSGLYGGIASGILFGITMAFSLNLANRRVKKAQVHAPKSISENEILFSSYASITAIHKPGWLTLTKSHLIFTRTAKGQEIQRLEIALDSIQEVKTFKNLMCDNGIIVIHNGQEQKFYLMGLVMPDCVVNTSWVASIQNAIKNASLTRSYERL